MRDSDTAFTDAVPGNYERYLIPLLFAPYALDLAGRLADLKRGAVLETACGTGAVTRELRKTLAPSVSITATDLNESMLNVAAGKSGDNVAFEVADAQHLPFADASFDALVCQFGVMFFPDRAQAFREALRVLKPGGVFLFNVWDHLEKNPVCHEMAKAVDAALPAIAPCFLSRVPFSCGDYVALLAPLHESGFETVDAQTVEKTGHAESARQAAKGLAEGSPLRAELYGLSRSEANRAIEAAGTAIEAAFGAGPLSAPMSAHVLRATR